jgi:hypothetical protein
MYFFPAFSTLWKPPNREENLSVEEWDVSSDGAKGPEVPSDYFSCPFQPKRNNVFDQMKDDDGKKKKCPPFCKFIDSVPTHGRQRLRVFLPQLDEFYFTTAEKKILENCRCIVPNFMNDSFI